MTEEPRDKNNLTLKNKKVLLAILFIFTVVPLWGVWLIVGVIALCVWLIRKLVRTSFFKKNKKVILIALAVLVVFSYISNQQTLRTERNRDYYINTTESVTFDCNASYSSTSDNISCERQTLNGEFSKYDTVEVKHASMNGNEFSKSVSTYIRYQNGDFDIASLEDGLTERETITLHNEVLNETVSEVIVEVRYVIDEQDLALVSKKHDEWKIAEEKRIAEELEEARKQEEEAALKQAEDEDDEEAQTEEAPESQQAEGSQDDYMMPDDISIYDIKSLCERYAETKGYPNAKIENLQGMDMENGKYYRVNGRLSISEGLFTSRRSVGDFSCTADYNEWYVTSAFLDREDI